MTKMVRIISLLFALAVAVVADAQTGREVISANPDMVFATHTLYPERESVDVATAPEGYIPFYISHYGRHGSRCQMNDTNYYAKSIAVLDYAHDMGVLTPLGEKARETVKHLADIQKDRFGELTRIGWLQHKGIARRMITAFPEVFRDSAVVSSISSTSRRCMLSMAAFNEALKECNPTLDIYMDAPQAMQKIIRPQDKACNHAFDKEFYARWSAYRKGWYGDLKKWHKAQDYSHCASKLFTDCGAAVSSYKVSMASFVYDLLESLNYAHNQSAELDQRSLIAELFSSDEIYTVYLNKNYYRFHNNAAIDRPICAHFISLSRLTIDDIVERANMAISGSSNHAADLRFGHDTYLFPLLTVMGLEGCYNTASNLDSIEKVGEQWISPLIMPMAANVQMVFYHRPKSKTILVRFLHNEKNVAIPELKAVNGYFYDWSKVCDYWQKRLDTLERSDK